MSERRCSSSWRRCSAAANACSANASALACKRCWGWSASAARRRSIAISWAWTVCCAVSKVLMDGAAMKLTRRGCCRGGRGGRPRDAAATVPSSSGQSSERRWSLVVQSKSMPSDSAGSQDAMHAIDGCPHVDEGWGSSACMIADAAGCTHCCDCGCTVLTGWFGCMSLLTDDDGLPGLKSDPIPAP